MGCRKPTFLRRTVALTKNQYQYIGFTHAGQAGALRTVRQCGKLLGDHFFMIEKADTVSSSIPKFFESLITELMNTFN